MSERIFTLGTLIISLTLIDTDETVMANATKEHVKQMEHLTSASLYLTRYGLMVMIMLGLIGNIMNILVFRQPRLRLNPCSFYLTSAAYANLIWIIASPFTRILATFGLDLSQRIAALCKIRRSLAYTLSSLSIMSLALATVDRCLLSSSRVTFRRFSSLQNAHRLVAATTLFYSLIFANMCYCLNIVRVQAELVCKFNKTPLCGFYNEIARLVALVLVPCLLLVIFGYGTAQNIKRTQKRVALRESTRRLGRSDRHLIRVCIVSRRT